MLLFILERANYWAIIGLMMIGLYITFASGNLIKRLVGLSLFGIVAGGTAPILMDPDKPGGHGGGHGEDHAGEAHAALDATLTAAASGDRVADLANAYSNPLPHVLMLTAIVVGVATLSVGLALIVRIREAYGTIEADEVREIDMETAIAQEAEQAKAEKEALA